MKKSLFALLLAFTGFAYSQQANREPTKAGNINSTLAKNIKKETVDLRKRVPVAFEQIQAGSTSPNPADTVSWNKLTVRKAATVKDINYNELAK